MSSKVDYLLSLGAIRDRSAIVWKAAQAGDLSHFEYHENRMGDVADFVVSVIKRDFPTDKLSTIPAHGRWQHFEVGNVPRIEDALQQWKQSGCDATELTRRLIDLFFVSVLLDAGAGDQWRYIEQQTGQKHERSEGIAVASLYMFKGGAFTGSESTPMVDGAGLQRLSTDELAKGFQASDSNPILGLDRRAALLRSLGKSLLDNSGTFGQEGRPGNLVDHMSNIWRDGNTLDVLVLWKILQDVLIPIWPKDRTVWLTYSLMVPFERMLNKQWTNTASLTVLAEYRNGGLFIDLGALSLKEKALERGLIASGEELPRFDAGDDVIVEWRALTIALIDVLYKLISTRMGEDVHLTLAQVIEAGTWKAGREVAAKRRPETKSSPILIQSDGTVF